MDSSLSAFGRYLRGVAIVACSLVLSAGAATASPVLYGITHFTNELITIDTNTGAGTLVGVVSTEHLRSLGLATLGDDLYTYQLLSADPFALDNRLLRLDATGAVLASTDVGLEIAAEGALAFRDDGTGFVSGRGVSAPLGSQRFWSFTLTGPSSSLITSDFRPMDGLDFSPLGVLFGLSQPGGAGLPIELFTIDPVTGVAALVGSTGINALGVLVGGLAFRPDGALFAVMNDSLYSLNPLTGAATLVGPTGFPQVSGLTFVPVQVPEPAVVPLLAVGWVGWRAYRRRSGRSG